MAAVPAAAGPLNDPVQALKWIGFNNPAERGAVHNKFGGMEALLEVTHKEICNLGAVTFWMVVSYLGCDKSSDS